MKFLAFLLAFLISNTAPALAQSPMHFKNLAVDAITLPFGSASGSNLASGPTAAILSPSPTFGGVNIPSISGNKFYSDNGSPQPNVALLGDRQRVGFAASLPYTKTFTDGQTTWGLPFGVDYILRDAHVAIGQTSGGYGIGVVGKASDYQNGSVYHVSSGIGCFQLSDVAGEGAQNYAECGYDEVASAVAGATAIGHEIAVPNYGAYPPTINPFQVNNSGYTAYLQLDPGGGSEGMGKDFYPSSCLICAPTFNGQALRGIVFSNTSIAGSNGGADAVTTISTVAGSPLATILSSTGVVAGQYANATSIPVGTVILAVWSRGRVKLSANATVTGRNRITFKNADGIVMELAPHHEIRWTNDTNGNRGAFIRNDSIAGQTSLGIQFTQYGIAFVNAATEVYEGGITNTGDIVTPHVTSLTGVPTFTSCGTAPVATANSTSIAGQITTGTNSTACTVVHAAAYSTDSFCTISPANAAAVAAQAYVGYHSATAFIIDYTVEQAGALAFNYVCSGI
jgi:hypothetical protein